MNIGMSWPQYLRREVSIDGRLVKLGGTAAEVVAVLLILRGKAFTSEELIPFVWPDPDDEPQWAAWAVYQALYKIRKQLPGLVVSNDLPARKGRNPGLGYLIPLPAFSSHEAPRLVAGAR